MNDLYIISDNCFGYGVYDKLKLKYTSPFIATYIHPHDYIKLLSNLDEYLDSKLEIIDYNDSTFCNTYKLHRDFAELRCITKLNDIEIAFHHGDKDPNKKIDDWYRRRDRLTRDKNKLIVIFSNEYVYCRNIRYPNINELIDTYHKLPYKKNLSFTSRKYNYPLNFKIYPIHLCNRDVMGKEYNLYIDLLKLNEN